MKTLRLLPILMALFAFGLHENARGQCNASFTAVQNSTNIDITNNSTAPSGTTFQWYIGNATQGWLVYSDTNSSPSFSVPVGYVGSHLVELWLDCGDSLFSSVTVDCSANPIFLNPQVTDATCNSACDGMIALSVTGGYGNGYYMDYWSNLSGGSGGSFTNPNLCAGTYSVTVSDSFGCEAIDSFIIAEPAQIQVGNVVDSLFPSCAGTPVTIAPTVTGGTQPYVSYDWSTGDTTTSITLNTDGFYTLTVTDINGCTGMSHTNVEYPDALSTISSSLAETSQGSCDGSANIIATNGTAPYSYAWSTGATTSSISALCAGTYYVTVTDANGCTAMDSVSVAPGNCYTISGNISPITDTRVYLIQESSGYLYAVDSVDITSGSYSFAGVCAGTYHVKAALLPASSQYGNWMPAYFQNAALWSNSTALVINSSISSIDIILQQGTNPGGPGFISGFISNGANRGEGDPVVGALVYLSDSEGQLVDFTSTDVNGAYEFDNLALGEYEVWADMINFTATPYAVTLTEETPMVEERNFEVAGGKIMPIDVLGISSDVVEELTIFPNPVNTTLYIQAGETMIQNVEVVNMTGSVILARTNIDQGSMDVPVENLAPGFYLLSVETVNGNIVQHRFIKE